MGSRCTRRCGWKVAIAFGSRSSTQTATTPGRRWPPTATITLAIHAWHGETVAVLQGYGTEAVWVERDDGDRRVIPVTWTSLIPRVPCRLRDGRSVRLSTDAALELARWTSARRDSIEEGGK